MRPPPSLLVRCLAVVAALTAATDATAQAKVQRRALLVGVTTYSKTGLADKPLPFASSDMEALGEELRRAGWTVTVLVSRGADNNARRADIDAALTKLLAGVNANDIILVGFSGHGQQFEAALVEADGTPGRREEAFFCPADAERGEPSTLFGMTELTRRLGEKGGRNLVLWDACRDDPRRGGKGLDGNRVRNLPANTSMLLSCAARQQSYETNQMFGGGSTKGHGIFTWHVLRALRGDVPEAKNARGEVSWDRMAQYLIESVNDDAVRWFPERVAINDAGEKAVQTPHWVGNIIGRPPVLVTIDPANELSLGYNFYNGQGVAKDYAKALLHFRRAAAGGNASSMNWLGVMHERGEGVGKDDREAAYWYRKAADLGEPWGMNNLGLCYQAGRGVKQDDREAVDWYRKAAEAGHAGGMYHLGHMHEYGKGVPRNPSQALVWYRKGAEAGEVQAMASLGYALVYGDLGVTNKKEGVEWCRKAAEAGSYYGAYSLGLIYRGGNGVKADDREAIKWFSKVAERGHSGAMVWMGYMYEKGNGVPKSPREAVDWYKKAVEAGNAEGKWRLGMMYESGSGVPTDLREALRLSRDAANAGYAPAMNSTGRMLESGKGTDVDLVGAAAWYRKAADAGDALGTAFLGDMYEFGKGVEKNEREALRLYRKAVQMGDDWAKDRITRLEKSLP